MRPQQKGAAVSQPPNTRQDDPFKSGEMKEWAVRKPPLRSDCGSCRGGHYEEIGAFPHWCFAEIDHTLLPEFVRS
jgi:hypothetical protein